jgi:hypothetical protein
MSKELALSDRTEPFCLRERRHEEVRPIEVPAVDPELERFLRLLSLLLREKPRPPSNVPSRLEGRDAPGEGERTLSVRLSKRVSVLRLDVAFFVLRKLLGGDLTWSEPEGDWDGDGDPPVRTLLRSRSDLRKERLMLLPSLAAKCFLAFFLGCSTSKTMARPRARRINRLSC